MQDEKPVWFTQLLRPDGRPKRISVLRPVGVADAAAALVKRGVRLEAEVLTTGEVSFTAEFLRQPDRVWMSLAHELVPNGPEVTAAVDRLIERATERVRNADTA